MSDLNLKSELEWIPSFISQEHGSPEELDLIFQVMTSLSYPIISEKASEEGVLGYLIANGKIARLTYNTGLMVSALRSDSQMEYELGYIYENVASALCWLLCSLGFGNTMGSFETEALIFPMPDDKPLRLSFETALSSSQVRQHCKLVHEGLEVQRVKGPLLRASLMTSLIS